MFFGFLFYYFYREWLLGYFFKVYLAGMVFLTYVSSGLASSFLMRTEDIYLGEQSWLEVFGGKGLYRGLSLLSLGAFFRGMEELRRFFLWGFFFLMFVFMLYIL